MKLPRRQFLMAVGCATACGGCGETLPTGGASTSTAAAADSGVMRTGRALGTDVSIWACHEDRAVAVTAVQHAFDELTRVEQVMSLYRPDSELCRLNRHKVLHHPHPYLVEVLETALALSRRTNGAFDVTVQPLWQLYAAAQRHGRPPSAGEVAAARARVDWRRVLVSPDCIRLVGEGTEVTLNGIAQGLAADKASAALEQAGIRNALLSTGETRALGSRLGGEAWRVGIQHPRRERQLIAVTRLQDRCLATSGDYATVFFGAGFERHHLFDPCTGCAATELASVSVVATTAQQADALSTAVFVLGPVAGARLVRETPEAEALFVTRDARVVATAGFPLA
ncbi:MAG: FAD:protein FMN transferase [Pirellulaceae bacterium]